MTSYEVLIHKKLAKSTNNLPKNHLEKFAKLIDVLSKNPYPWKEFDLKKIEGTEDTYRIRFGKYRIIYYIPCSSVYLLNHPLDLLI